MLINMTDIFEALSHKTGLKYRVSYENSKTRIHCSDGKRDVVIFEKMVAHDPGLLKIFLIEEALKLMQPGNVHLKAYKGKPNVSGNYIVMHPKFASTKVLTSAYWTGTQWKVDGGQYTHEEITYYQNL